MEQDFKDIIYKYFGNNSSYWDEDFENAHKELSNYFSNRLEKPVMPKIAEEETNKEYWHKRLRSRYDPVIAFNIGDHNPNIKILEEAAKEEGCLATYRATEGCLKGFFVIVFSGLYR